MDLWYPAATILRGPPDKFWPERNTCAGVILHSMGGRLDVALDMLADTALRKSWHFSIGKNGIVYQHYPITASVFHSGNRYMNGQLVGIEHEGGLSSNPSEPLTALQEAASVALVQWVAAECGWEPKRGGGAGQTLWEHNEVSLTACPSGRIDWSKYEGEVVVQTRPLDQAETIQALNQVAARFGSVVADDQGETAVEITGGYPVPTGMRAIIFVLKETP